MMDADRLREVMTYDAETGRFYWKDRPRSDFKRSQGYGAWKARCQGKEAGADTGHGYRCVSIDCKRYLMHRLAWLYVYGVWPSQHIDHINGNGGDNRIANLRDVSTTDNHRNTKLNRANKSGVAGVSYRPKYGTWAAAIWDNAKIIHLGSYPDKAQAIAARRNAERKLGYHPNHGRE